MDHPKKRFNFLFYYLNSKQRYVRHPCDRIGICNSAEILKLIILPVNKAFLALLDLRCLVTSSAT